MSEENKTCFYCGTAPRSLKGQMFQDPHTKRVFHMKCIQKKYLTEYKDPDQRENVDAISIDIFRRFQDLIRRVDPDWRP